MLECMNKNSKMIIIFLLPIIIIGVTHQAYADPTDDRSALIDIIKEMLIEQHDTLVEYNSLQAEYNSIQEETNEIMISMMESSTDVWYQGYNERLLYLYNSTDKWSDEVSCTYYDILLKGQSIQACK